MEEDGAEVKRARAADGGGGGGYWSGYCDAYAYAAAYSWACDPWPAPYLQPPPILKEKHDR